MMGVFCFQIAGSVSCFLYLRKEIQQEIKSQIKAGIPEQELHRIIEDDYFLSHADWWEDHEFRLDGVMYDIVKTEMLNGQKVFLCINDTEESELFTNLGEQTDEELKNRRGKNTSISLLLFVQELKARSSLMRWESPCIYRQVLAQLPSLHPKNTTPPPRFT